MSRERTECLAVIPARGGSKGIPGKNLMTVGGVSLVARAVAACLRSQRITAVVVSTDDERIAAAAREAGAEVVHRPPELSGDMASSESALLHALHAWEIEHGRRPDNLVLVQCTSPFVEAASLDALVDALVDHDSAFLAAAHHRFVWRRDETGSAVGVNHDGSLRKRRQDLEPEFVEAGAAYSMRTEAFARTGNRFSGRIGIVAVTAREAHEIDDQDDLELARLYEAARPTRSVEPERLAAVRAVVFDFDGVMTDDRVLVMEDGTEAVLAHRGDGMGVQMLRRAGLTLLVLSREQNRVVAARARKLGVDVIQGCDDKPTALRAWAEAAGLDLADVAFVGNDLPDLGCLDIVGLAVCPADARPPVRGRCGWVLASDGGHGAVREMADAVLRARREISLRSALVSHEQN